MGLAGELTTIGLAEVFQNLAFNHLSGVLTLEDGERTARIGLENGRIRAVRRSDLPFDFVDIARRAGLASETLLDKAGSGKRRRTLKAFLRAAGDLDEEAFDGAIAAAVEESLLPLFGWNTASFTFEEGKFKQRAFDREVLECGLDFDPQGVSMEAARRHDEWETISTYVPSDREVLVLAGALPAEELRPEVEKMLLLLDGTRDLRTILDEVRIKRFDLFKIVAGYVETGHLVPATTDRLWELAAQARVAGEVTLAVRRLETALGLDADDLEIRRELARLYERAGRKADAARETLEVAEAEQAMGDLEGALASYERARVLAPDDLDILERVFRLHESRGEKVQAMKVGWRLAEALVGQEMYEDALPFYERLLAVNSKNAAVRDSFAQCLLRLDRNADAAEQLRTLGGWAFQKGDLDDALVYYQRVLEADEGCEVAARRVEEIETGHARRQRVARRRRIALAAAATAIALLAWQGVREWNALSSLHEAEFATARALAGDNGDRARLATLGRYSEVCATHRFTRAGARASDALRELLAAELERIGGFVEAVQEARTTAQVEYALHRSEKLLREIGKLEFPDEVAGAWRDGRDRIVKRIALLKSQ